MKDKISDNISKALDVDFVPEETENDLVEIEHKSTELVAPEVSLEDNQKKQEAEEDYQRARKLSHRTMVSLEKVLDQLDSLAPQMETGAFFGAYAQVIAQANAVATDSLDIQAKRDALAVFVDDPKDNNNDINIENAIVYTGTLSDMQRQLKKVPADDEE